MAQAEAKLAAMGFALGRSAGPVDYYRITAHGADEPAWIVARQYEGGYLLLGGNLRVLKEGRHLRAVLPAGWVTA